MSSRAVRSLALACSLLLALPQGWCCRFAVACHEAKATTSTNTAADTLDGPGETGDCCHRCPHKAASTTPTGKPSPAEKPSAPTQSVCACSDRQAAVPSTSVKQVNDGFVLLLPPLTADAHGVGHPVAVVGTDLPPPTRTLHILNCVWLC
jgi:hypothetical protein